MRSTLRRSMSAFAGPSENDAEIHTPLRAARFAAWFEARGWSPRAHQLEMVAKAREGRDALRAHLAMLEGLAAGREWLAGRRLSQADLIAAGHLSVLDYFGEIPWQTWPALKTWYSKLKSRPCFRPLLADRFVGVPPSAWYADLDF